MSVRKFLTLLLLLTGVSAFGKTPYSHDPKVPEEVRVRGGLPNVFAKLKAGKEVNIGYLGGSITKAEGWRVKTFAWLKEQYPKATLNHIDAAVPGTGASFAACRMDDDLLKHNPDLVFVEFRVNGARGFNARAIEGVTRQIWRNNPNTDICLVYTIGKWMIKSLSEGKQHGFGVTMERMANEYGIPSIDLGVEVVKQMKAGTLEFKTKKKPKNKLWFAKDNCHPVDEGHELYKRIIARSLIKMRGHGTVGPHVIPEAITPKHFVDADLIPITKAKLSAGWKNVDQENDKVYSSNLFRTNKMLGDAVKTTKIGASFTIEWTGRLIALTTVPAGKGTEIEVSIDGGEPETYTFDRGKGKMIFAKFQYLKEQKPGKHTAKVTVTKLPKGSAYYAGQFLTPSPE